MKTFTKLAIVAAAFAPAAASATTVDFEELTPWDGGSNGIYATPLTSGGLVFSNPGAGGGDEFLVVGPSSPIASANGTNTLIPNYFGSTTTVTAANGNPFTLNTIDISDTLNEGDPVAITFHFSDGSTQLVTTDLSPGMQTFTFNVANITSFDFTAAGDPNGFNTAQYDNFVYTQGGAPGVPEPATWALMIGGLGLVGGAMRHRTAKVTYA